MAGLLVGTETDVGHGGGALELTAASGINTLGTTPALLLRPKA